MRLYPGIAGTKAPDFVLVVDDVLQRRSWAHPVGQSRNHKAVPLVAAVHGAVLPEAGIECLDETTGDQAQLQTCFDAVWKDANLLDLGLYLNAVDKKWEGRAQLVAGLPAWPTCVDMNQ